MYYEKCLLRNIDYAQKLQIKVITMECLNQEPNLHQKPDILAAYSTLHSYIILTMKRSSTIVENI
uniref:Uncharacterized protein n=1 Tax=Octopus bimaculoides TaxID=37653 RepID=A0A0L8FPL8_OCTBM